MYDMTSSKHRKSFILSPYILDAHDSMKTPDKKSFTMIYQRVGDVSSVAVRT
jgi:hypothetical protein